jgi:hypothetical protein
MPTKTLWAGVTRWTVIRCECDEVFQFDSPCSDFELLAHLEEKGGAASLRLLTAAYGTKLLSQCKRHVGCWRKLTTPPPTGADVSLAREDCLRPSIVDLIDHWNANGREGLRPGADFS